MPNILEIGEEPSYWAEACDFLAKNDPVLNDIIKKNRDLKLVRRNPPFHTVARAITGQQISVHAADSIWGKLQSHIKAKAILPEKVVNIDEGVFRSLGFSSSKQRYIKNVAEYFLDNHSGDSISSAYDIERLEKEMLEIKGVGRWTADMFLIFYMHHPDVLPIGDIGLLKGVKVNYKGYSDLSYKELKPVTEELSKKWAPYSTVATLFLWKSIDPVSVEY